ncbi:MAG: hypothetical protein WD025_08320 [Bacteriovoracaceae bacterium]
MVKNILFFIFTILISLSNLSAKASSYVTYPDFVLMERQKKIEVIDMVQRYTVEAEYQSDLLLKKNSPKYTWVDWIANSFTAYANRISLDNARCMYGGWFSIASKTEASGNPLYCSNPKYLMGDTNASGIRLQEAQDSDEILNDGANFRGDLEVSRAVYKEVYEQVRDKDEYFIIYFEPEDALSISLEESPRLPETSDQGRECDVEGSGDIICNPAIFGKPKGKPLCVPGDQNKHGYNSSYLCQQAVAHIKKNEEGKYDNVYDEMMEELIAKLVRPESEAPRGVFLNTMRSMYSMCMCANDGNYTDYKGHMNEEYAQRMFNTRTCVGLVNQTKELLDQIQSSESCEQVFDHGDQDWLEFATKASRNLEREITSWRNLADIRSRLSEDEDPFRYEENSIQTIRDEAIAERGTENYCHVDLEAPVSLAQCIIGDEKKTEDSVTFSAIVKKDEEELEGYSLKKGDADVSSADGVYSIALSEFGEDQGPMSLSFVKEGEERVACSLQVPSDDDLTPPDEDNACELALSSEPTEGGFHVTAKITSDGEQIEPGTEGYSVSFTNTSQEAEQVAVVEDDDMLVDDHNEPASTGDKQDNAVEGRSLATIEDSFKTFVASSENDQIIHASLAGPDGSSCSAEATYTLKGLKPPRELTPLNPKLKRVPGFRRPGKSGGFMRGNR